MKFVLSGLVFVCFMMSGQTSDWRSITPLLSTCEDVKKILQVNTCSLPKSEYSFPDYRVRVSFADQNCEHSPRAWRVPRGTVLSLVISPQHAMTVSQLGIDLSNFKKREGQEIVGVEQYDNEQTGASVELFQGHVVNVTVGPRKSDSALRCDSTDQADAQTDPTGDQEASAALKHAWKKFTADGLYRVAVQGDMSRIGAKARAFAYSTSSLGFERHDSAFYHLAAIVIDTKRNDSNRFGLVIFSGPRTGNGSYSPYWVLRDQDLSQSYLDEYVGFLDLVTENELGATVRCRIRWETKNSRYVCRP